MKTKLLVFICMLCAVIACNRESEEYHNDTGSSLTEEQALSAFAQTLSKAVFESVVVDYNTPYILGKDSNNKYQLNPLSSNNIIINILPYYEVK